MRGFTALLVAILSLMSVYATGGDLNAQLTQFFKNRYGQNSQYADNLTVVLKSPQSMWPACEQPQFSVPGNSRLWGNISVAANCEQNRRYIQVQVQVTGSYLVAANPVMRGATIATSDMRMERGRLDTLPARTLTNADEATGAVALRDITPGQPVTMTMMRQPWRIKTGQTVTVTANGDGFNISSEGKAMNNAAAAQMVRVRMNSGQIVMGKVDANGNILISL